MMDRIHFCFNIVLLMSVLHGTIPRVEITNFVCTSPNKDFGEFDYCILKAINRTYKYISMKFIIYQKPLTNIMVNFALYKRANGYKPFLYNISIDACKFILNQKKNPVTQYFYGFIKDVSNLNHSCPYNEDITLEKLSLDILNHRVTALLPFPGGDYLFQAHWSTNRNTTVTLKVYITIYE